MHGRTLSRCLVIGILLAFSSGCSLSSETSMSRVSIRMSGTSPVAKLFAPFTQALSVPSTTAGFDCLGVNVMGLGIAPRIHDCGCTGTSCTCGQDEVNFYQHLDDNITGKTFCGYAGVTSSPVANDLNPKTIKLVVPSGPKRIVEVVGVVDPGNIVCSSTAPLGDDHTDNTSVNKPSYYEVGRAVVDLFQSKSVPVPDTWTDLQTDPAAQAKRLISCNGDVPPSYLAYIPNEPGLVAYWPMVEQTGSAVANAVSGSKFNSMNDLNGAVPGATGPLLQSADQSLNYALSLPAGNSTTNGIMNAAFTFSGGISVEAWVNIPAAGTCGGFAKIFELDGATYTIKLHCLSGNEAGFAVFDGSTTVFSDSSFTLPGGGWHHVVGVYNPGAGAQVYVDGTNVSMAASGTSIGALTFAVSDAFTVSSGSVNGLPAGTFVSHVAVYATALTPTQIQRHFHASGR